MLAVPKTTGVDVASPHCSFSLLPYLPTHLHLLPCTHWRHMPVASASHGALFKARFLPSRSLPAIVLLPLLPCAFYSSADFSGTDRTDKDFFDPLPPKASADLPLVSAARGAARCAHGRRCLPFMITAGTFSSAYALLVNYDLPTTSFSVFSLPFIIPLTAMQLMPLPRFIRAGSDSAAVPAATSGRRRSGSPLC